MSVWLLSLRRMPDISLWVLLPAAGLAQTAAKASAKWRPVSHHLPHLLLLIVDVKLVIIQRFSAPFLGSICLGLLHLWIDSSISSALFGLPLWLTFCRLDPPQTIFCTKSAAREAEYTKCRRSSVRSHDLKLGESFIIIEDQERSRERAIEVVVALQVLPNKSPEKSEYTVFAACSPRTNSPFVR